MMKGLEIIHLCRKISAIPLSRGIRTDTVLLATVRRRRIPRRNPDEPGIRRRRVLFQNEDEDAREEMENEGDLEDEVDVMNIDKAYYINKNERSRNKRRLEYILTAKKFFAPRPQPSMLTCNERECIKYLHKEDPVQWNIKTLSESFPATPDAIKKIIKAKWKITPKRAKAIDEIVQKNWELLAEGKLDADPDILEHFKRFVNRREVLLEQLKNQNFYLPEVKTERVWNKGEFSGLLQKYEREVQQLVRNTDIGQEPKMLKDGMEKNNGDEYKSSLDLIHAEIDSAVAKRSVEKKDSFLFKEMSRFYSKHTTLEDLEDRILKRADKKKNIDVIDKAILEAKFDLKGEKNVENSSETLSPSESIQQNMEERWEMENKCFTRSGKNDESIMTGSGRFNRRRPQEEEMEEMEVEKMGRGRRFNRLRLKEMEEMEFKNIDRNIKFNGITPEEEEMDLNAEIVPSDERTLSARETDIGKLLETLQNQAQQKQEAPIESNKNVQVKPKIDFSDPERLKRENIHYDNEVKDIENTAFWNSGRSSKQKALAEQEKRPHEGPEWAPPPDVNRPSTAVLSQDPYPERIKIPKDKQRSGLIFKVKDCYYDDDGEFLYRVPGMSKVK